jgi:hypothetical protein
MAAAQPTSLYWPVPRAGAHHPRRSADPLRPHRHAPRGANLQKKSQDLGETKATKQAGLADQNAKLGKRRIDRPRCGSVGAFRMDPSEQCRRRNVRRNRNRSSRSRITDSRMGRYWSAAIVKSEVGQCHLGQDQDGSKQHQLENQNRQLPALHENATCTFIKDDSTLRTLSIGNTGPANNSYFPFAVFDRILTRAVTCCAFSMPPKITRPSGMTSRPR